MHRKAGMLAVDPGAALQAQAADSAQPESAVHRRTGKNLYPLQFSPRIDSSQTPPPHGN